MKRYIFLISSMLFFCGHINAGSGFTAPVRVDIENNYAEGTIYDTRFSDDINDFIGCMTHNGISSSGREYVYANCIAVQSSVGIIMCTARKEGAIAQIHSITDRSLISFKAGDGGECEDLSVGKFSYFIN